MKRSKKVKRKTKSRKKKYISLIIILLILILGITYYYPQKNVKLPKKEKIETMYLANITTKIPLYKLETETTEEEEKYILIKKEEIVRGTQIQKKEKIIQYEDKNYALIIIDNEEYYVEETNLTKNKKDIVQEETLYIRNATTILEDPNTKKIKSLAKKGESIEVLSYDKIDESGNVNFYQVKIGDIEGYVYGKYTTTSQEEASKNYMPEVYDPIHSKISNTYNGGEAIKLDFYPSEKKQFENNKMPSSVYALYLNGGSNTLKNIDAYINFAKETKINAFVVDIKDNESPSYPAKIFENLSPTNYEHAINSYDDYKIAITKLKEAGFYVIGRITVFKDSYYVKDHPEDAITNKNTGSPYLHNGSYWPSAYDRDVWYFNVSLAKEAVEEFGFHEINFDYVRFPDRMNSVSNTVDLKNTYQEDKTEAIQRFVQYACDVLHEKEVYVSIDVFGETTNGTYTTAYGQYWPAISNVADVISGMPYPDHFSNGYYGIQKPWNNPYQLLKYWAKYASDRQKEIPTPAKVRTWIQAYDVMKYVDPNGITYNAEVVEQEIRGLYEGGARDGYITWLSNSSLEKYKSQKAAFQIDYEKEYTDE